MDPRWQKYLPFAMVAILLIIMILGFSGVFTTPVGVSAEAECNFPAAVCGLGTAIGIPSGWLRTNTFLWYTIIPIAAVWMIIYGFLDRIRIFRSSISAVLAFLIAFSMIPLGIFVLIVATIFSFMGVYSVVLFFILFIVGTLFYSRGLFRGWKDIYKSYDEAIDKEEGAAGNYQKEIDRLNKEIDQCNRGVGKFRGKGATVRKNAARELIRQRNDYIKLRDEHLLKARNLRDDKRRQRALFKAEEKT